MRGSALPPATALAPGKPRLSPCNVNMETWVLWPLSRRLLTGRVECGGVSCRVLGGMNEMRHVAPGLVCSRHQIQLLVSLRVSYVDVKTGLAR